MSGRTLTYHYQELIRKLHVSARSTPTCRHLYISSTCYLTPGPLQVLGKTPHSGGMALSVGGLVPLFRLPGPPWRQDSFSVADPMLVASSLVGAHTVDKDQ